MYNWKHKEWEKFIYSAFQ